MLLEGDYLNCCGAEFKFDVQTHGQLRMWESGHGRFVICQIHVRQHVRRVRLPQSLFYCHNSLQPNCSSLSLIIRHSFDLNVSSSMLTCLH